MNALNLQNYVCGAYFVTYPVARPQEVPAPLLPPSILSAAAWIAQTIPNTWMYTTEVDTTDERLEAALGWKIDLQRLPEIMTWASSYFGQYFAWPNVCLSLHAAQELVNYMRPSRQDIVILGLGLHTSLVDQFMFEEQQMYSSDCGVFQMLTQRVALADGGVPRGFEVLGINFCEFYSWLDDWADYSHYVSLDIKTNSVGLLEREQDIQKVLTYAREDIRENVGLWLPWLLVQYPIHS